MASFMKSELNYEFEWMVGAYVRDDGTEDGLYLDEKYEWKTTHIVSVPNFVSIYKEELTILEKMGRKKVMSEMMKKAKMEWMNAIDRNMIKKIEDANFE